jgi:hypothetical protein
MKDRNSFPVYFIGSYAKCIQVKTLIIPFDYKSTDKIFTILNVKGAGSNKDADSFLG